MSLAGSREESFLEALPQTLPDRVVAGDVGSSERESEPGLPLRMLGDLCPVWLDLRKHLRGKLPERSWAHALWLFAQDAAAVAGL